MKFLVDSYAWIAHFRYEGEGPSQLESCVERGDPLYTPSVVLAEIARKFRRDHLSSAEAPVGWNK
ncbi:MAG: hypothetical protein JRN35_09435 [Nitrososphaerota archaeon]|nr:hypothetical protein [Nitrososphaerota archaeon]